MVGTRARASLPARTDAPGVVVTLCARRTTTWKSGLHVRARKHGFGCLCVCLCVYESCRSIVELAVALGGWGQDGGGEDARRWGGGRAREG